MRSKMLTITHQSISLRVGNNIKLLRKKANMSQVELAHSVGVSQAQIQRLESGDRSLKIDVVEKIGLALRVDFLELVSPTLSPSSRKIPLSGVVNFLEEHERQGGITIEYPEHIVFETQRADLSAFWVWDDSVNVYVPKESVIVVDPTVTDPKLLDKKLVVVLSEGRFTFGRWQDHVTALWAKSQNSENDFWYRPKFGDQFLGRVISFTKTYGE